MTEEQSKYLRTDDVAACPFCGRSDDLITEAYDADNKLLDERRYKAEQDALEAMGEDLETLDEWLDSNAEVWEVGCLVCGCLARSISRENAVWAWNKRLRED